MNPATNSSAASELYATSDKLPYRFNHPDTLKGYGAKTANPVYMTSNSEYG